jgi:hypothetical protein
MMKLTKRQTQIISAAIQIIAAEGVQNLTIRTSPSILIFGRRFIGICQQDGHPAANHANFIAESQDSITKALKSDAEPLKCWA